MVLRDEPNLAERVRRLYLAREYDVLLAVVRDLTHDDFLGQPELAFHAADAMWRVGNLADALKLTAALLQQVRAQGNSTLLRNILNLMTVLQFELGELDTCEQICLELLCASTDANDANFAARANNNLGIVYTVRGRVHEAMASYQRALSAYRQLGYVRGIAQTHHNLGITYRELRAFEDADNHFRDAMDCAREDGSDDEIARVEQERALLILEQERDTELAEVTARSALRRFEALGHQPGIGDAHRVLAIIAFAQGKYAPAMALLQPAFRIAREAPLPLLEAESLEVLAAVLAITGNRTAAAHARRTSRKQFKTLGASAWGRQCRSLLQRVSAPNAFVVGRPSTT